MKTLICFSLSSTLRPRSVLASLTADELAAGNAVTVLDVSNFSYVRQDLPPAWWMNLCGQEVRHSAFLDFFEERGVPFRELENRAPLEELPNHVKESLDDAAMSETITYTRSDAPATSSYFARTTLKRIADAAEPAYWALREELATERPDEVLIPNGRVAHQRVLIAAATDEDIPIRYYEIGRAMPFTYYRGPYQVHDRTGTQQYVRESTATLTDSDCKKLAYEWLTLRMAEGSATNPYSARWVPGSAKNLGENPRRKAVFFSSSVDEFASYGARWLGHDWNNQFDAFGAIMRRLDHTSTQTILRIHPNLVNKSRGYIRNEVLRVKSLQEEFPDLTVYWHTDSMNSYDLLQSADMVFVGRSTLGLEGSCLGKSVWTTTASRYDEFADVRRLFSPNDLEQAVLEPWEVDKSRAWRFIASWIVQDHPLTVGESRWSTFDSANAPLCARIGSLLVPNSWLHRFHLIRLEIRRWMNVLIGRVLERRTHAET